MSRIVSRTWSSSFLGRGVIRISGNSVLLKERNYDTMLIGSAKKPGRRYHTEGFWNMKFTRCFYRPFLHNYPFSLLVQRGSVEV